MGEHNKGPEAVKGVKAVGKGEFTTQRYNQEPEPFAPHTEKKSPPPLDGATWDNHNTD